MARRKSDREARDSAVNMGDAAEWRESISTQFSCRVRLILTRGAGPGEWRVDAQAVAVGLEHTSVIGAVWEYYPNRRYSSIESVILNLLMRLDVVLLEKTGGLVQSRFAA